MPRRSVGHRLVPAVVGRAVMLEELGVRAGAGSALGRQREMPSARPWPSGTSRRISARCRHRGWARYTGLDWFRKSWHEVVRMSVPAHDGDAVVPNQASSSAAGTELIIVRSSLMQLRLGAGDAVGCRAR